ncbi:uncharacterized protein EI90DRAFT_80189 [Cantharellus anzutake]|uniref:uncharacterized protein n=1 Tax=Cantharellus anzutake TaxID=1750568 RepID=UPI001908B127|nr:uncharacterized protein EI90DRAFT_80189 [Cantharellus anzutake]KAF8336869.1 hypothetical protein EI90DRAFT_80189 [Cantharellus anzutake]
MGGKKSEEGGVEIVRKILDLLPRMMHLTDLRSYIPLTIFSLNRSYVLEEGQGLSSLRKLFFNRIDDDGSWRHSIPWHNLTDIHFSYFPNILLDVVGEMRNLRSIKLMGDTPHIEIDSGVNKHIAEFLRKVPSDLEALHLEELTADIPVSIFTHSLKRLRLHSHGHFHSPGTRSVISAQQLDEMCVSCPLLEELEIDINRDGEWPHVILDKVAKFPCLKKLALSLECPALQIYSLTTNVQSSCRAHHPSRTKLLSTPSFVWHAPPNGTSPGFLQSCALLATQGRPCQGPS